MCAWRAACPRRDAVINSTSGEALGRNACVLPRRRRTVSISAVNMNLTRVSQLPRNFEVAYGALKLVVGIVGLVTNGIIVYLFIRYRTLRTKDGLYFMVLLAVCDALNSLSAIIIGPQYIWEAVSMLLDNTQSIHGSNYADIASYLDGWRMLAV